MPGSAKRRPLILAVDDDPSVLEALHLALDDRYEVLEARDGDAALALVRSQKLGLVLLDLLLEGIDGITVLEKLRARRIDVPVVILSGLTNAWTASTAMRLGAVDYVTKPFDEAELLAVIAFALRRAGDAAKLCPTPQAPRILLIGCPVGTTAALITVLSTQAHFETIPARGASTALLPPVSPDAVVIDTEAIPDSSEALGKVRARFPLAPIIAINVAIRDRGRLETDAAAPTILLKPVTVRDLLGAVTRELRPSIRSFPRLSARVLEIMQYVGTHFATAGLRDLGQAFGKSPSYLSRSFSSETGMTLKTYVNRVRVEAARQLLLEIPEKIETIAGLAGFHDASHLSRLFVKYLGRRPGAFRQAWQEDPARAFTAASSAVRPK